MEEGKTDWRFVSEPGENEISWDRRIRLDISIVDWYLKNLQARSSGGEHYPDTVGVKGSNPFVPTR